MNYLKYFELSNPQKRIWLTEVLNNHLEMSNIGYLIELKGKYDLEQLAQAIKYVVKANDSLQLRFKYSDKEKGELVQYITDHEEIAVSIIEAASEEELFEKELHIPNQPYLYLLDFQLFRNHQQVNLLMFLPDINIQEFRQVKFV